MRQQFFFGCTVTLVIHTESWMYSTNHHFLSSAATLSVNSSDSVDVWPQSHNILPLLVTWQRDSCSCCYCLFISTSISALHPQRGPCILYDFMWVQRRSCQQVYSRWCPSTLSFWLLLWIMILQRQILLDYFCPPLSHWTDLRPVLSICMPTQELCSDLCGYGNLMNC